MLQRIKNEPAVVIGVLVSLLTLLGQVVAAEVTVESAIPAAVGILVSFFVTPSSRVSSFNYVRPSARAERGASDVAVIVVAVVAVVIVLILVGRL